MCVNLAYLHTWSLWCGFNYMFSAFHVAENAHANMLSECLSEGYWMAVGKVYVCKLHLLVTTVPMCIDITPNAR